MKTTVQPFVSDVPCPECGAPLEVDPACVIGYEGHRYITHPQSRPVTGAVEEITIVAPAVLCTGCHFCLRIE